MSTRQRQMLISGLAYGLGLLLGNIVSYFLFQVVNADLFLSGSQVARLILGVLLAFLIAGFGGVIGGAIGGTTLPIVGISKKRSGYVWRSGITFGFGYGLLVFPLVLIITLLSFYDISSTPFWVFSLIFGIVGVVFGLIMGLSLALWTVGRRFRPITQYVVLGFGLGGSVLGYTLWRYIFAITQGDVTSGPVHIITLGFFAFAALGGAGLGYAYQRLAEQPEGEIIPVRALTVRGWRRRWLVIGVVLFALVLLIRPLMAAVGDLLTPIDAQLSPVLELHTEGTHWFAATPIAEVSSPPQMELSAKGEQAVLAWVDGNRLWLRSGQWDPAGQETAWQAAILISEGEGFSQPQLALDENGQAQLIWIEEGIFNGSQCTGEGCSEARPLLFNTSNECAAPPVLNPTLAASDSAMMLVWENRDKGLSYATWPIGEQPESAPAFCVPTPGVGSEPQLAVGPDESFHLVYSAEGGTVATIAFSDGEWGEIVGIGDGRLPANTVDNSGKQHVIWCEDEAIAYWDGEQRETVAAVPGCLSSPQLAEDSNGQPHAVWFQDAVENVTGDITSSAVIVESTQGEAGWTEPAIIGASQPENQPSLAAAADGSLHLAWADSDSLNYAAQVQYECDSSELSRYGQILYDVVRREAYTPPEDPVPFCQNRIDQLLITPNPDPAYSDAPALTNGAYDALGDLIREAEYEVLFSTMWYSKAANHDSPGAVIAAAVADLYGKLRANPELYPRGMTVRILLDNPPELARGETSGQLWSLLDDLRYAGIDQMVDEELGWKLEVADYEGNMPHSHVKTVVIDGKTAAANGFNMTYDHLPQDHPSGLGGGRFDLGLVVTGPAAQATQRMFDDMWNGADQRHCLSFDPPFGIPWQATCYEKSAAVSHVPEVQKFYLAGGDSTAFSMYRSKVHDQADRQTVALIEAAQESVDAIHVNFALDMICDLNILFNVCTIDFAPDYMDALIQAAENGAKLRILVKPGPTEGIENNVAMDALNKRLQKLGIADRVEVRYFDGPVHTKALLVDEQVLVVGSQNFHYSAFGEGSGLNEYSFAVEDPQAVQSFKDVFEYQWNRAGENEG